MHILPVKYKLFSYLKNKKYHVNWDRLSIFFIVSHFKR